MIYAVDEINRVRLHFHPATGAPGYGPLTEAAESGLVTSETQGLFDFGNVLNKRYPKAKTQFMSKQIGW